MVMGIYIVFTLLPHPSVDSAAATTTTDGKLMIKMLHVYIKLPFEKVKHIP